MNVPSSLYHDAFIHITLKMRILRYESHSLIQSNMKSNNIINIHK